MVSVICNYVLNTSVNEFSLRSPGAIFDKSRELLVENFAKSDEDVKDGMDASMCALNFKNMSLQWSGANNPLWIYRIATGTIEEYKPDKQPIGKGYELKPFTTHDIVLNSGDIIYVFTDGYADQFGGERNKKLTRSKFRELLLRLAQLPMDQQRNELLDFHNQYRGSQEQVDAALNRVLALPGLSAEQLQAISTLGDQYRQQSDVLVQRSIDRTDRADAAMNGLLSQPGRDADPRTSFEAMQASERDRSDAGYDREELNARALRRLRAALGAEQAAAAKLD